MNLEPSVIYCQPEVLFSEKIHIKNVFPRQATKGDKQTILQGLHSHLGNLHTSYLATIVEGPFQKQ